MSRAIPPAAPYLHLLERVDLETQDWPEGDSLCVKPIWKGVDRPDGTAYAFLPKDAGLAERLRQLILDGGAYSAVVVRDDIDRRSFVSAEPRFSGRTIARDLKALGA